MLMVRIEHAVPSFDAWKRAFDGDPVGRRASGVQRYRVLRQHDNPNLVMIDLEFASIAAAEAFLAAMQRVWAGPGKTVMLGPTARIADVVEVVELQ